VHTDLPSVCTSWVLRPLCARASGQDVETLVFRTKNGVCISFEPMVQNGGVDRAVVDRVDQIPTGIETAQ